MNIGRNTDIDTTAIGGAVSVKKPGVFFHIPNGVLVRQGVVVAVFGNGKELLLKILVACEISSQSIPKLRKGNGMIGENHLLNGSQGIGHGTDAHTTGAVGGGVDGTAVVDVQTSSDAVLAETGQEGSLILFPVEAVIVVPEQGHVLGSTGLQLQVKPRHEVFHGSDRFRFSGMGTHLKSGLQATAIT